MATQKQEELMRELAGLISEGLDLIYEEKMGFFLVVSPMSTEESIADYIGNCDRRDSIAWMKETVQRLEGKEDIPATEAPQQ